MSVKFDDLELAFMFISDTYSGNIAYLCKKTGKTFLQSEFYDTPEEKLPDDIDKNDQYIELPSKNELELGKTLAIEFTSEHLPSEIENVYSIFRSKGAYSRYKSLLDCRGVLDEWYKCEQAAQKRALLTWCSDNGIEVDI